MSSALHISLLVASCALLIIIPIGVSLGYFLARYKVRGRDLIDGLCTLPMVLPPTVIGYGLLLLLGSDGWIGGPLKSLTGMSLVFTWQAASIAAAVVALPLMIKTSRAAFESVQPNLELAALSLGQSPARIFFRITMPLAWKGLVAGTALSAARSLGEFGATIMVAGNIPGKTQTLPMAIYEAAQSGDDTLALRLVIILTIMSLALLVVINRCGSKW